MFYKYKCILDFERKFLPESEGRRLLCQEDLEPGDVRSMVLITWWWDQLLSLSCEISFIACLQNTQALLKHQCLLSTYYNQVQGNSNKVQSCRTKREGRAGRGKSIPTGMTAWSENCPEMSLFLKACHRKFGLSKIFVRANFYRNSKTQLEPISLGKSWLTYACPLRS